MDLKCRQLNCKHNDCYCCTCKGICVTRNGKCDSFEMYDELPKKQQQDVSSDMFDTTPNVHPYRHKKNVNITCNCKDCLFNKEQCCCSNGLTFQYSGNTAECITRIKE